MASIHMCIPIIQYRWYLMTELHLIMLLCILL